MIKIPITVANIITDFDNVAADIGKSVVIKEQTKAFTAGEYDNAVFTVSGGVSGVCVVNALGTAEGGADLKFLEQGVIELNDQKCFLTGSIPVSETSILDIASSGNTFEVVQILPHELVGSVVYRTVYIRKKAGGT